MIDGRPPGAGRCVFRIADRFHSHAAITPDWYHKPHQRATAVIPSTFRPMSKTGSGERDGIEQLQPFIDQLMTHDLITMKPAELIGDTG